MLIWSRHNRPGPAVAQSPHNNPPRPRLSPLLPPPAPRSPGRPSRPRRALRRRRYHSAPQGGSGRRAGGGRGGRGGEARLAGSSGNPNRALIKSPQRRGRLSGFLPRGRSGTRTEALARARDSLPSQGGRNAASLKKGRRDPSARVRGAAPLSPRGLRGRAVRPASVGALSCPDAAAGRLLGFRAPPRRRAG